MMGGLWGLVTIIGPILFLIVVGYALVRNRTQKNQPPKNVTEEGTRRLHEQINQDDQARAPDR